MSSFNDFLGVYNADRASGRSGVLNPENNAADSKNLRVKVLRYKAYSLIIRFFLVLME